MHNTNNPAEMIATSVLTPMDSAALSIKPSRPSLGLLDAGVGTGTDIAGVGATIDGMIGSVTPPRFVGLDVVVTLISSVGA